MDTKMIWGIILIVVGVGVALYGAADLYDAIQIGNQMNSVGGAFGVDMGDIAPSKMPGILSILFGAVCAFFGTKLLQKKS